MCRQTEMRCGCSMCTGRAAHPSREPLASAPEPEARGDWHKQKNEVKIDLSRDSSGADGIGTDERDDPPVPRGPDFVHNGGWLLDPAGGGIFLGSGSCNNAGHDKIDSRCK